MRRRENEPDYDELVNERGPDWRSAQNEREGLTIVPPLPVKCKAIDDYAFDTERA